MRILLIDDLREIFTVMARHGLTVSSLDSGGVVKTARTFEEGIEALANEGPFDVLYLDHDLGDPDPAKTGYGIVCFLEANPQLLPKQTTLVTSNPVGRERMKMVLDKLYGVNK